MRILLVEDDRSISHFLLKGLREERHIVDLVEDGVEAEERAYADDYDVIILDLMLPGMNGVDVCRRLRAHAVDTPILMLTARGETQDRITGLDAGADDYLTKPFGVRELMARVGALMRRHARSAAAAPDHHARISPTPDLVIDPQRREVRLRGEPVELTKQEFDVLHLLARRPGIVFSRAALLEQVWPGDTYVTERTVDTVISRLRRKIERDPHDPELILTAWGVGYKFADSR